MCNQEQITSNFRDALTKCAEQVQAQEVRCGLGQSLCMNSE